MSAVVADAVGHRVIPVPLPYSLFLKVARQQRIDPLMASVFVRYVGGDMKAGVFAFEGGVTDDLQRLTGEPAESFDTTARRYAGLPFARQSASNRMKAFAKFMATPFLPGYNLKRLDRHWDMPVPRTPALGIEDARWRDQHRAMMNGSLAPEQPAHSITGLSRCLVSPRPPSRTLGLRGHRRWRLGASVVMIPGDRHANSDHAHHLFGRVDQ